MCDHSESSTTHNETTPTPPLPDDDIVYGGLFVIGFNGTLPSGDRGRKCSKFIFKKRRKPNGVKKAVTTIVKTSQLSKAVQNSTLFSISYAISEEETTVVQYNHDEGTDMFQIGRASDKIIDFVVLDNYSKNKQKVHESTVSRFACRLIADRSNPQNIRLCAAGFGSNKNISLGVKAVKWMKNDNTIDALTTNGVLLNNPEGKFCGGELEAEASVWREVSVCGNILSVRGPRSSQEKGREIKGATNILRDGSLIDLCGITLLWRSSEGLKKCMSKEQIEDLIDKLNDSSVRSAELVIPRRSISCDNGGNELQPHACINCGHVYSERILTSNCPSCRKNGSTLKLYMGMEPAFYVDDVMDSCTSKLFAFNPCGHIATEKTVKYWSKVPLPHGTCAYQAICPFCATELQGYPGYVCLKFDESE